jgi:hypothetical protein
MLASDPSPMESEVQCPYCGEPIAVWIDPGGGDAQSYIEDCSVCCRPFEVHAVVDEEGTLVVQLGRCDG